MRHRGREKDDTADEETGQGGDIGRKNTLSSGRFKQMSATYERRNLMLSSSSNEKRHDRKNLEQHVVERPRSRSTSVNSAISNGANATQPMPIRLAARGGTAKRAVMHLATRTITASMMGVFIGWAVLVPTRGTSHRIRRGLFEERMGGAI